MKINWDKVEAIMSEKQLTTAITAARYSFPFTAAEFRNLKSRVKRGKNTNVRTVGYLAAALGVSPCRIMADGPMVIPELNSKEIKILKKIAKARYKRRKSEFTVVEIEILKQLALERFEEVENG